MVSCHPANKHAAFEVFFNSKIMVVPPKFLNLTVLPFPSTKPHSLIIITSDHYFFNHAFRANSVEALRALAKACYSIQTKLRIGNDLLRTLALRTVSNDADALPSHVTWQRHEPARSYVNAEFQQQKSQRNHLWLLFYRSIIFSKSTPHTAASVPWLRHPTRRRCLRIFVRRQIPADALVPPGQTRHKSAPAPAYRFESCACSIAARNPQHGTISSLSLLPL